MGVFGLLNLVHMVVLWNRVVVYNGEGLMKKMWREEVASLGVEEVLAALVGVMWGVGSVVKSNWWKVKAVLVT